MNRQTHYERISLVLRVPGWHGWLDFAPRDRHTLAQRVSVLNSRGWNIYSRRQTGKRTQEYRMLAAM